MSTQKVAFPSTPEGLNGPIGQHFGHCEAFTVVEYDETSKEIIGVEEITNLAHEEGGCMRPVMMLKNSGIESLVVGGIGPRPFMGCNENGILVYAAKDGTVKENADAFLNGELEILNESLCHHH